MSDLKDLIPINEWFSEFNSDKLLIAGPCSAETEAQVLETAKQISNLTNVNVYRAGIWKPRTRPGSFEGIGEVGLKWLTKVKQQTNLKTAIEVATPEHIKFAIENKVDILWIGARTVSNPFSVQQLADELKGIDIPVLIKNSLNPDIELWQGAIERIYSVGIRKIAAVHRGFYPFEKTNLRNIPKWEIPIELKTRFHNLPIICDPSHIAGKKEFVSEISQKALDIDFDGLMIETHINPEKALSDAKQQILPTELESLLKNLKIRKSTDISERNLDLLRENIDSIDKQMLELLAKRMDAVGKIGEYKKEKNIAVFQLRRWEQIISSRKFFGVKMGLSEEFIKKILQIVHKESIAKQNKIMNK
jgi:chorismate mutase